MNERVVKPKREDYRRRYVLQIDVDLGEGMVEDLTRDEIEDLWDNIEEGLGSVDFQQHGAQVIEQYYASEVASISVQAIDPAPGTGARLTVGRNHIISIPRRRSA